MWRWWEVVEFQIYFDVKVNRITWRIEVRCKNKRESWLTPRFFTSAVRRLKLPLIEEGKTMEGVGFGRDSQELRVEYINTELPISHPNKEVN